MERTNKDLQARLDLEKWLDSEKKGVDKNTELMDTE